MNHQAAWIKEKHGSLVVGLAETPSPGPEELLMKVMVIGFNPIESKIQQ
jgi:NADPH:quinone reductase-like Zn-dependent oxidoreductase